MKKKLVFLPLVAGLALAGCSSDEPVNGEEAAEGAHYLAVNIVPTPNGGGKYATQTGDPDGATYEDGLDQENKVTSVRFYFFDESGQPLSVKAGQNTNYYDWNNPEGSTDANDPNVEKNLNAVLLIETKKGDVLPSKIVAVVNPDRTKLGEQSMSLSTLADQTGDFSKPAKDANPRFVMCNSVYMSGQRQIVQAQTVDASNYKKSQADALAAPVIIYVERNVAKVRVKSGLTANGNGLIQVTDKEGTPIIVGGKQVYVKLNGWNVTATLQFGYTSKHLNSGWYGQDIFGNGAEWNWPAYFRSFWAAKCVANKVNQYGNFHDGQSFSFTTTADKKNYTYCNENGDRIGNELKATQVIIPATLCDETGNPFTITEYAGIRFADNASMDKLKDQYLSMLRNSGHGHYKKTIVNGEQVYTEISRDDITFITATAAGEVKSDKLGGYYVYACLTTEAENADWYSSNVKDNTAKITKDEVNAHLKAQQHAKIWNSGMTYYYFDIKHIGNLYGTIRNHIYDANLTALYGLGTPVYDPDETIYPEKPVKDDTFIAAQIKILSWRVIPNNVTLDWGD